MLAPHARAALLLSLGLAACDARDPLSPRAPKPRAADEAAVIVASGQVSTPENTSSTSASESARPWRGFAVPESAWVVVRVNGGVLHTWNPDCARTPPNWTCAGGVTTSFEAGPFNTGGSGQLDMWLAQSSSSGNSVFMRPVGASEATAMEGVLLIAPRSAATLWVRRRVVLAVGYDWTTTPPEVPKYFLTDRQTITVTRIPNPRRVIDSEPDSAGTITFTAQPYDGLEIRNPSDWGMVPPGNFVWRFIPGDSVGAKPDLNLYGGFLYDCERKPVCKFKPPRQGRVQVEGFVERVTTAARSEPVIQPPKPVNLACTPSVITRGQNVVCTASSEGRFRVTKWTFSDGNGIEISPPNGDPQNSAKTWGGQMVAGGTITVQAISGGELKSASVTVNVLSRG